MSFYIFKKPTSDASVDILKYTKVVLCLALLSGHSILHERATLAYFFSMPPGCITNHKQRSFWRRKKKKISFLKANEEGRTFFPRQSIFPQTSPVAPDAKTTNTHATRNCAAAFFSLLKQKIRISSDYFGGLLLSHFLRVLSRPTLLQFQPRSPSIGDIELHNISRSMDLRLYDCERVGREGTVAAGGEREKRRVEPCNFRSVSLI